MSYTEQKAPVDDEKENPVMSTVTLLFILSSFSLIVASVYF